ncbi:hypothetical protein VV93_v1c45640 (plasmid) [Vibrio vulnificus]|nr:hypothetical protein VV93_v1c45640 [Vibrio vulnificus]
MPKETIFDFPRGVGGRLLIFTCIKELSIMDKWVDEHMTETAIIIMIVGLTLGFILF